MTSAASQTRRYRGKTIGTRREERRTAFLEAGLAVFGDKGYSTSTVTDICAAAGLARSQFYAEFADREALLIAVYDKVQSDAHRSVVDVLERIDARSSFHEKASAAVDALFTSLGTDPRRIRVCSVEVLGVSDRVELYCATRRAEWALFFEVTIKEHVGQRFIPPGGYQTAATAYMGAMSELLSAWCASDPRPPIENSTQAMKAILQAFVPHN
ncbi:TetR/AcrR family transcriptional regulator [Rhodococcus qingshengii]|uniref:TetR/AcrR family transcriptional regulator n=1 Tax=Rhodococcus qingshengii TaxID=334542 RepID=UPI00366165CD